MNRTPSHLGLAVVAALAVALGAAWWFGRRAPREPVAPAAVEAQPVGPLAGQPAGPVPAELATTLRPPLADRLGRPGSDPAREPEVVLDVLDAYRRAVGGYPAGEDNRQIVRALLGANPQRLPFLPRDHARLSGGGELLDAWGRPFFFHLIARDHVEVRSAGPDRALYTADDFVAGRRPASPPR